MVVETLLIFGIVQLARQDVVTLTLSKESNIRTAQNWIDEIKNCPECQKLKIVMCKRHIQMWRKLEVWNFTK